jgi:2,3-bisphosphoglycerate-independent phosphoglycerate mutase
VPSHCILILLDGLGDRSFLSLGNMTPLEAASTPNLDKLAASGINGLLHADRPGRALPSENAHFAMFGYQEDEFPGRGYLEALGADIALEPGDVAILAHFVSVERAGNTLVLTRDKPEFTQAEIDTLLEEIASFEDEGVQIKFIHTKRHEGILTMSGNVSPLVTDTDPFIQGRRLMEPLPHAHAAFDFDAKRTARVLKKYLLRCHEKLSSHPLNEKRLKKGKLPLNALVSQRPGRHKEVQAFYERWGLKALSISSGIVYWGLCRFVGINVLKVKDSADIAKDFAARMEEALGRLDVYDFIHVHTKAPDNAAHDEDAGAKKKAIEAIDKGLGEVVSRLIDDPEILTIVTSDHSTPSESVLIHSGEPVPITIVGKGVRRDGVKSFGEVSCASGALGFIQGQDLMHLVLNHLERIKLRGAMDMPEDQPYWPGPYEPFSLE